MTAKNGAPTDATQKPEGADEREETKYSYPVLKLHQNGHDIFLTTIPIDDLFPFSFVERFHENPEVGYQRKFDSRRADEIAEYLSTEGESIPSSIVLSAQDVAELSYSSKTKQLSYQLVAEAFAVLDGQHRLWGYQKCRTRHRVPVAIYAGLDQQTEARLFLDINNKHKGVPKAHLVNVKSVAGTETETEATLRRLFTHVGSSHGLVRRDHPCAQGRDACAHSGRRAAPQTTPLAPSDTAAPSQLVRLSAAPRPAPSRRAPTPQTPRCSSRPWGPTGARPCGSEPTVVCLPDTETKKSERNLPHGKDRAVLKHQRREKERSPFSSVVKTALLGFSWLKLTSKRTAQKSRSS